MDLIKKFGEGFEEMIEPLTGAIKTGFSNLIYVDPNAQVKVLSDVAEVGVIVGGAMLAVGFVFGIFKLARHLMGR